MPSLLQEKAFCFKGKPYLQSKEASSHTQERLSSI